MNHGAGAGGPRGVQGVSGEAARPPWTRRSPVYTPTAALINQDLMNVTVIDLALVREPGIFPEPPRLRQGAAPRQTTYCID